MENSRQERPQESLTSDLAQRMLEVPKAWNQYLEGTVTAAQFQQTLANLSDVYAAIIAKQKEPSEDLLWKQYALHVDLYKHYLEQIQKFSVFYYAVTGAIISFYFTRSDLPIVKYALLLPILMSLVFGVLFGFGAFLLQITRKEVSTIIVKLNLDTYPEINVLAAFLVLSGLLMLTVAGVLLWFFFPDLIPYSVGLVVALAILLWWLFQ